MLSKAELKTLKSLHESKGRSAERLFLAEGLKLIAELLGAYSCALLVVSEELETEVKAKDFKTGTTITARCGDRDLLITRLPSTSRAYPMKLEKKAEAYRKFFVEAGFAVA